MQGKSGFWRRQISANPTEDQFLVDWIFGILLPIVCIWFDPIIFREGIGGGPSENPLHVHAAFAYTLIALEILCLVFWFTAPCKIRIGAGVLGGAFFTGAAFAWGLAVCIFPLSLLALVLMGLGLLGLVPWLTGFVFLRNGIRAIRVARGSGSRPAALAGVLLGAGVVVGAALWVDSSVTRYVDDAIVSLRGGELELARERVATLRIVLELVPARIDQIALAFERETDPGRRESIAKGYEQITGHRSERILLRLRD
jgi:hypothetical protein